MKLKLEPQNPLTDDSVRSATGKGWQQWFDELDAKGGPAVGRRPLNEFLFGECKVDAWWTPTIVSEYEAARGVKEKDGIAKGYTICATKTIVGAVDKVYAQWASAAAMDKWLGSGHSGEVADGGTVKNSDGDVLSFKRVRENKDLRFGYEHEGVTPGTTVDVAFADKGGGKTGLTITHDRLQTRADADALRAGWGEALDRLKALVEN